MVFKTLTESMTTSLTRSGSLPPISRMADDPMLLGTRKRKRQHFHSHDEWLRSHGMPMA